MEGAHEARKVKEAQCATQSMTHQSHSTRYSDSSLYDEVCKKCGATDANGDERLNRPCPNENGKEHEGGFARFHGAVASDDL